MPDVKRLVFTFITVFVVPVLFFVLLEFSLGVLGIGKSFDFFHEIDIDGEAYYQENADFADQFYPASLDIRPRESTFSVDRPDDLTRVYILGGSAALGFPHENHGLDRLLDAQLRAALPSRKIEVINSAMTSVNSHVVYAVANSIPYGSADFAVILMGNNEVVGPYGPGTLQQGFLGSIGVIRGLQALKRTRTWQALDALLLSIRPTDAIEELEWQGMQMFTNNGVLRDDPRMQGVYAHYEDNLTRIIETLQDKGIHVILSSVPVNLRHSAPFMSVHRSDLSEDTLEEWAGHQRQGASSADAGDWDTAARHFEASLAIDPEFADTHFRLATVYEKLGEFEQAAAHYQQALDLDALRFRADTGIGEAILNVASRADGDAFSFVDSAARFRQTSEPYEAGWNLLLEHVHFSFTGNHLLAAGVAGAIIQNIEPASNFVPLTGAEVATRVGYPNYDTPAEIQTLQAMIEHPPFPGQSNYRDLIASYKQRQNYLARQMAPPTEIVRKREAVVSSGQADWKIHFELAVLYERMENNAAMIRNLQRIIELYPHNGESYMKLAQAKGKEGKWREAIPYLERSLLYTRGDSAKEAQSISFLGTAYLRSGNYDEARNKLRELTERHPDQVPLVLGAYGNMVRYARQNRKDRDLQRYIRDVQRYAQSLVRSGKAEDFPPLNQTMAQILSLGGYNDEAREWAAKQQ